MSVRGRAPRDLWGGSRPKLVAPRLSHPLCCTNIMHRATCLSRMIRCGVALNIKAHVFTICHECVRVRVHVHSRTSARCACARMRRARRAEKGAEGGGRKGKGPPPWGVPSAPSSQPPRGMALPDLEERWRSWRQTEMDMRKGVPRAHGSGVSDGARQRVDALRRERARLSERRHASRYTSRPSAVPGPQPACAGRRGSEGGALGALGRSSRARAPLRNGA